MIQNPTLSSEAPHRSVLIVDDEDDLLATWSILLELEGFSVIAAHSASEGLEAAIAHHPSVVITDYRMPGVDGLEFCRRLKADSMTRTIPVIMWTGTPMQLKHELFERIAVKPVALATMLALIGELVS